jgi:hypothetical protein
LPHLCDFLLFIVTIGGNNAPLGTDLLAWLGLPALLGDHCEGLSGTYGGLQLPCGSLGLLGSSTGHRLFGLFFLLSLELGQPFLFFLLLPDALLLHLLLPSGVLLGGDSRLDLLLLPLELLHVPTHLLLFLFGLPLLG